MRRAIRKHAGDVALLGALAVLAIGVAVYILNEQGLRFPVIEPEPFEIKAELSDAGGVKPGQNQAVRMAFVRIGEIKDVELDDGRALLTLAIEPEYADRIREDATALLRPKTGLEDMFLDIDPGSEDAPPVDPGHVIPISNTRTDVDSEEVLSALDSDARAYLDLLINGAGKGLEGRGRDLREAFRRLEPLHRDLARVNGALARQRRKLRRLVHDYGSLTTAIGREDERLSRLVGASNAVFAALASQDDDISAAVARLPGALAETESALRRVDAFSDELGPALDSLRPAMRELDEANPAVRELARATTPIVREEIRPFARTARPYIEDLQPAARGLSRATPDLRGGFHELNRFFNMAAHNPGGAEPLTGDRAADRGRNEGYLFWLGWLAQNTNSLFSTADASGPFRRANFSLTCTTLRRAVRAQPLAETVLGVTNLLADTGLCPREGGEPLVPLPDLPELADPPTAKDER